LRLAPGFACLARRHGFRRVGHSPMRLWPALSQANRSLTDSSASTRPYPDGPQTRGTHQRPPLSQCGK
jgi:hypothetical protein